MAPGWMKNVVKWGIGVGIAGRIAKELKDIYDENQEVIERSNIQQGGNRGSPNINSGSGTFNSGAKPGISRYNMNMTGGGGSSLSSSQSSALNGLVGAFTPSNQAQAIAIQNVITAFSGGR